jgi:hypothetical protein
MKIKNRFQNKYLSVIAANKVRISSSVACFIVLTVQVSIYRKIMFHIHTNMQIFLKTILQRRPLALCLFVCLFVCLFERKKILASVSRLFLVDKMIQIISVDVICKVFRCCCA